jgi:hypothetical protein
MQGETQLHQLVITRQFDILKEYSNTSQKCATELVDHLEKCEALCDRATIQFKYTRKIDPLLLNEFEKEFHNYMSKFRNWIAERNTQIVLINVLFHKNYEQIQFDNYEPKNDAKQFNITIEQSYALLKDELMNLKEVGTKIVNDEQKRIKELGDMLIKDK